MARARGATMSSSSASGNRSNTKRSTCTPTTASAQRAPRLADIWISTIDDVPIPVLTGARRTRPTSTRRPSWRRHEFSAAGRLMRLRSGYALQASHPPPGAIEQTKPGGTPLIIRGKLFRLPEPALAVIERFKSKGVATLILDPFTPRGEMQGLCADLVDPAK